MVLAAGCGMAKVISRNKQGGIIELQGDRGKAMEDANQQMAAHCGPGNFSITQEGEEAIGTDTVQQQQTTDTEHTSRNGRTTKDDEKQTEVTSTRTATAWRVHYACGQGAAQPVGAPPPAGPPPGDPNQPAPEPAPGY
ncbi:MAG TPA: hypothetical protein VGO00_09855 [Kofleriaceae bacterium]|nr:hypothetical protein [Kofleriaceae bacterium]